MEVKNFFAEVNSLRKENQSLKEQISKLEAETHVDIETSNIAFEESVVVYGTL